jgi:hypothetical protein
MNILYIGDSHANFGNFRKVAFDAIEAFEGEIHRIVSVGDFGVWPRWGHQFCAVDLPAPVSFIDGNHEDFYSLANDTFPNPTFQASHIKRGTFDGGVFYMGGATSIDKAQRTLGNDWFEEENISYAEFYNAANVAESNSSEINVMCAHDSVMSAYPELLGGNKGNRTSDPNAEALEQLYTIAKPKVYVHGHHHVARRYKVGSTAFVSLDRCCRNNPDFRECTVVISTDGEILT